MKKREMREVKGGFKPAFTVSEINENRSQFINTPLECGFPYVLGRCGNPVYNHFNCKEP